MTLETVYYIGQTVAVVALVVSLVFVGVQIRLNTLATRAASHHAVSDSLNEINRLFAENEDVTRIWVSGIEDRNALTVIERWRFDATMRAYFHVCETMFIQANLGSGDRGIFLAEEEGMKIILTSSGAREWWSQNPYGFCNEFRNYIDSLANSSNI